jgi:hypothetical protein
MFDAPVDALPVWLGLTAASVATLGVVTALPVAPPPDAGAAAATVDAVAASEGAATAEHGVRARLVDLRRDGLSLRGRHGASQAGIAYGPITPVRPGTDLHRVLTGVPPGDAFDSPRALERASRRARERAPVELRTDRLLVRHVVWEGVDVTLVGA